MYQSQAMKELTSTLKLLPEEDLPLALYEKNWIEMTEPRRYYERGPNIKLLKETADYLSSIHNLDEIKGIIINSFLNMSEYEVYNFIDSLNQSIKKMHIRGYNRSSYKKDKRHLYFTLNIIKQEIQMNRYYAEIKFFDKIKNEYFNPNPA